MTTVEQTTSLRHAVGFYTCQQHLVDQITVLVQVALGRARPVVLGVHAETDDAVRRALGPDARIASVTHPDGPQGGSGQTLICLRARDLRRVVARHGPTVVITQHLGEFDGPQGRFWTELDAAANIALADLPVELTCFFPERPEHAAVLLGARRNHALLLVDDELHHNPEHRDPHDVLTESPVPPPPERRAPDQRTTFGVRQLVEVRRTVEAAMLAVGAEPDRAEDVSLAVNEVATNAVQHGAATAELQLWSEPGECVFEVHDRGVLGEVLPGLRPPRPAQPRHRGLWIARQLCDYLHVWTDADGTHVRIHATA